MILRRIQASRCHLGSAAAGRVPSRRTQRGRSATGERRCARGGGPAGLAPPRTRHDAPSLAANIVCAHAHVEEPVQDPGAELQRLGRYALVDAVEHTDEVQVRRQAQRCKTEAPNAEVVPRLPIGPPLKM